MKTARFWTRARVDAVGRNGKQFRVAARGWSDDSIEAAQQCALEIARKVADFVGSGKKSGERYPYGVRPLPEPVVQEFRSADGQLNALVTRNQYGALVLNAPRLMFVDIDEPEGQAQGGGLGGLLGSLFGKPKPAAPQSDPVLDSIGAVVSARSLSARAYKTAAGHRLIITNAPFAPDDAQTEALLKEFGCDPLYIRLCRSQESFRARLTPKPWRCDMMNPPAEFPIDVPQLQDRYNRWLVDYDMRSSAYATCRYLTTFGGDSVADGFAPLIEYHDVQSKATSGLKLA
ncbi:MAG: hypothetical protein JOY86_02000 [Candidatus Eremiobacteraeota bacterium]|nr:hypothetical protein [Candidatus Eremiobacteraeota bacterium]